MKKFYFIFLLLPFNLWAQENLLDSLYGTNNGYTELLIDDGNKVKSTMLNATIKLPNGKILAVGTDVVARFTSNGILDTTFNSIGYKIHFQKNFQKITSSNDGNYLVNSVQSGISKIDEDGDFVTTFTTFNKSYTFSDIALDSVGNIYILAHTQPSSGIVTVIIKLFPDGTQDLNYGTNGELNLGVPYHYRTLKITAQNEFLLGGALINSATNREIVVSKLDANGSFNSNYGNSGHFTYTGGQYVGDVNHIDVLSDGSVVGFSSGVLCSGNNCLGLILYKLKPNGTLDTTFYNGGIGVLPIQSTSTPSKIERLADGSYIVVGTGLRTMYALKIDSDGNLDQNFGQNGLIMTPELSPVGYAAYCNSFELYGKSIVLIGMYSHPTIWSTYISVLRKYYFSEASASLPKQSNNISLKLYPNPASSFLQFESDQIINEYSVYNASGKKILSKLNPTNNFINIETLAHGVYTIQFFSNQNHREIKRFIKK
ncbi:MAG TPA: T9SS type A sorting domain-containing protein [Flavobacterium sp.]|nr:T9SS type A sorting domain-containing protein [Flavobacterium sp.]